MKKLILLLLITTAHASTFTAFAPQKLGTSTLDIAQAQFLGSVTWQGTTNCNWQNSTTAAWNNFSADVDCDDNARTIRGSLNSTNGDAANSDGQLPQIKFSSISAGTVRCEAKGLNYSATSANTSHFRFSDGTNSSSPDVIFGTGGGEGQGNIIGDIHYSSDQGATTIQIQSNPEGGSAQILANSSVRPYEISCYHFPSAQNSFRTTCSGLECENTFTAVVTNSGTIAVASESPNNSSWVSLARTGAGYGTGTFAAGLFGVAPKLSCATAGAFDSTTQRNITCNNVTTSGFNWTSNEDLNDTRAYKDQDFTITATRQGSDYNQMDKRFVPVVDPSDVLVEGISNAGQSITTNVTPIPFTEVIDTDSAWDGDTFTVPAGKGGEYSIKGIINGSAAFQNVELYKNGTLIRYNAANSLQFRPFNFEETLNPGDTVHLRINLSGNVVASTTLHHIRIRRLKSDLNAFIGNLTPTEFVQTPGSSMPVLVSAQVQDGSSTTTVSQEDDDFLNGNCSNGATGSYSCTFTSNYWASTPHCWAQTISLTVSAHRSYRISGLNTTSIAFDVDDLAGSAADIDFLLFCKGEKL